jgi:tetratricopeptide (TPR) repeat protein
LLRRLDADGYRDTVRDALLSNARAKLVELAAQDAALEQPPAFVAVLADCPEVGAGRRRQLLTAAVGRRPGDLGLLMALGHASLNQKDSANEELRWYQAAVAAAPANYAARNNLGVALADRGRLDEAIACYHKAIEIDPKDVAAHTNLGNALGNKGQLDEAIACYHKAIEFDPKCVFAHDGLGITLCDNKRDFDGAITCFRKAIEIDPDRATSHTNLGVALANKGRVDEAIACYRKAIALDPKLANAHANLGFCLDAAGKQKEAIEAWRTAARLEPRRANTHYWLGKALLLQGRPGEALGPLGEAAKRFPAGEAERLGLPAELSRAKRLAGLEKRLPALLAGEDRPADNQERLEAAELCRRQERFAAAAHFWAEAFAADAMLADDVKAGRRFSAACFAALAAAGRGEDAGKLDDKAKARLRQQALDWLRADLALRTRQLETGKPDDGGAARQALRHWQEHADLAGLRDEAALARLPADEQKAFTRLWADVAALLNKAEAPPQKEDKR